jgi:cytoskeletal protein RodZ
MPDMNDNEKQKLDSIIVRILLIFGLGFLAVEAWKNVFGIAQNNSFPELERDVREAEKETNKLKKAIEEANRDRPSDPNQSNP